MFINLFIIRFAEEEANPAPVDSATELVEPPPPDITDMCRETFTKTSEYLKGELTCKALSSVL